MQGYAPTPHSYIPNTSLSATINLDEVRLFPSTTNHYLLIESALQEVKLTNTRAERDLHDSLAELFSIIVTLDELEKAFLKDAIPESEYTDICERSLRQYKALLADETIAQEFQGLEEFKAKFDVCFSQRLCRYCLYYRSLPNIACSSKRRVLQSVSASACPPLQSQPAHRPHQRSKTTAVHRLAIQAAC